MHQAHVIPWRTVTSYFRFWESKDVELQRRYTQNPLDLTSPFRYKRRPLLVDNVENTDKYRLDLTSFVKKLVGSIREFSTTERAKYPAATSLPYLYDKRSKVISDESFKALKDAATKYGQCKPFDVFDSPIVQTVNWWKDGSANRGYSSASDVVKLLLQCYEGRTLLSIAHLGPHNLKSTICYGQSFELGWIAIVIDALRCYIFLNCVYTYKDGALIAGAEYTRLGEYYRITNTTCMTGDADSHVYENLQFWVWIDPSIAMEGAKTFGEAPPVYKTGTEAQAAGLRWFCPRQSYMFDKDVFTNLNKVRDYIKQCFHILYLADMLMTELSIKPAWEYRIMGILKGYGLPVIDPHSINPTSESMDPKYVFC